MTSLWHKVPLDVIIEQVKYLSSSDEIKKFCEDPYIREKLCSDPNGKIWQNLFQLQFSDNITPRNCDTIMDQYLKDIKSAKIIIFEQHHKKTITDLHLTVERGYEKIVRQFDIQKLIRDYKSFNIMPKLQECLITSTKIGNLSIMKYLIENGVDSNLGHIKLLVVACSKGYIPIVKYLIDIGMKNHTVNTNCLNAAIQNGNLAIVKYLVEHGSMYDLLSVCVAAKYGHLDIIEYLISKGIDIKPVFDHPERHPNTINILRLFFTNK